MHRAARWCVRPLAATAVTPSHVTTARLATGLAAAAAFAMGEAAWNVAGGTLFVISAFLDRADGELARMSGRITRSGHRYDLVSDLACNVMAFAAIGAGLGRGAAGAPALWMGLVSATAIGSIFWLVDRMESMGEAFAGAGGFDPDDVLFVVGPAAWFGGLAPLLYAAAVCAPLFLLFALWRYMRLRFGPK